MMEAEIIAVVLLFSAFFCVVWWFGKVDFYNRHFFHSGIIVVAENAMRIVLVAILSWLIYAPGAAVIARLMPEREQAALSIMERAVMGFGTGLGLWHVTMLILGVIGMYYRSVMVGLCLIVLASSARRFGRVAMEGWRTAGSQLADLRFGRNISFTAGAVLIALAAVWLLLVRGLYPGGGGDYYTHYFYYYLQVLQNHSLAPNDVWYHYWYSKGSGLVFLGMLLSDPEAPALITFSCVAFAAIAIAALASRVAPRSLWPVCGALLYLLFNLISISHGEGGEFQKDHETVTALVVLVAWAVCMARGPVVLPYLTMAASAGVAAAIITQPIGVILALYFALLTGWAILRRQWISMWRFGLVGALIGGTVLAIFALNYIVTGLISDQALGLTLRFANFARLDQWGVIPQLIIIIWGRDNYEDGAPPLGWEALSHLRYFLRYDVLWVFLAGVAVAGGLFAAHVFSARGTLKEASGESPSPRIVLRTIVILCSLLGFLIAISTFAGRVQSVSFERFCTFFVPLIVLLGIALCGWVTAWPLRSSSRWGLRVALPLLVLAGTLLSWDHQFDWSSRVSRATANGLRFVVGGYSLAEAYAHQDVGLPFGGINPGTLDAWHHVEPGSAIWSTNVNSYCMAPGCWVQSVASFKMSSAIVDILNAPPQEAKRLLQQAGLNYFLFSKESFLIDILSYSRLFALETIGQHLGVKWTNGSTFLLTWIGPETVSADSGFLDVYRDLLKRPEHEWFRYSELGPQIAAATARLRQTGWGAEPAFGWRELQSVPGQISIFDATYGRNCRTYIPKRPAVNVFREGNSTSALKRACGGRKQCTFTVEFRHYPIRRKVVTRNFSLVTDARPTARLKLSRSLGIRIARRSFWIAQRLLDTPVGPRPRQGDRLRPFTDGLSAACARHHSFEHLSPRRDQQISAWRSPTLTNSCVGDVRFVARFPSSWLERS